MPDPGVCVSRQEAAQQALPADRLLRRLMRSVGQPGVAAEVKYDPEKPKRMQILTLHIKGAASSDTATRLEELNGLRDKGLITEEEYRQKREDILKTL